jgi:hypothetical protein
MHRDFHLFGPINKRLADKQFAREGDIKQAFISWLHILDISYFCAIVKALVLQWDICINISMVLCGGFNVYHLFSMYYEYIEVTIGLQASECSLPYFFKHLCVSSLIFISKLRLFLNVTVVTVSLFSEVGVVGFLWNPGTHVPHHIVP